MDVITMACEMRSESRNSNHSGPLTTPMRTTSLSRRLSSSNQLSGVLANSGSKDYRLNADYNADSDHARITMKTCVAVRDKTPHRFQVVPLRDVSKLAALEDGYPSQLALPHTLLRSASIRRQTHSQVRPVIASSHSQVDVAAQDNYNAIMLADGEDLATPSAEMLAIPVLALSPFELESLGGSHALAEQDMNRQCTKYMTSIITPTKAPQSYDASYQIHVQNPVALSSDRSPSVHTTSLPLDHASCNSGTYPKISKRTTSEHLFANAQSSILEKSPRKKRTRSENIPSIRNNNQRDGRNVPAATVAKESWGSRMTKGHAIYTQSLYVPFLESPSYFPGSSTENWNGHHHFFGVYPNENVSDRGSFSHVSQPFVSDSGTTVPITNSDDQGSLTSRDLVEAAGSEQSLQILTLKPRASVTVPHTGPHRPLKYPRLSRVYPLSAGDKIVCPPLVREMFTEIDRAIYEWKHI